MSEHQFGSNEHIAHHTHLSLFAHFTLHMRVLCNVCVRVCNFCMYACIEATGHAHQSHTKHFSIIAHGIALGVRANAAHWRAEITRSERTADGKRWACRMTFNRDNVTGFPKILCAMQQQIVGRRQIEISQRHIPICFGWWSNTAIDRQDCRTWIMLMVGRAASAHRQASAVLLSHLS